MCDFCEHVSKQKIQIADISDMMMLQLKCGTKIMEQSNIAPKISQSIISTKTEFNGIVKIKMYC